MPAEPANPAEPILRCPTPAVGRVALAELCNQASAPTSGALFSPRELLRGVLDPSGSGAGRPTDRLNTPDTRRGWLTAKSNEGEGSQPPCADAT